MIESKVCQKCNQLKHLSEFYKYESSGNTYTYWCKECIEHYIKTKSVGAN